VKGGDGFRAAIANPDTTVLVSAASVWEISIEQAAGRLDALIDAIEHNDFDTLPITASRALAAGKLAPHHADPFDRMLIAQAEQDRLTLVTVDRRFADYDVELPAVQ
jgi:PIN domain nuclease of toxin-antitoxin system